MRSLAPVIAMAALVLGVHAPASAQSNPEAEQAFRDGKELMEKKQYAAACEAFAASDRLEPNAATRASLADCQERRGKLASAWGLFLGVAASTRGQAVYEAVHQVAVTRAAALEPRLPYLTISVADASRVEGLSITRNEVAVDPAMWNRAVPIDAGTYVVRAAAPGREPWSTSVTIDAEGQRHSVDVPRFDLAIEPVAAERVRGEAPSSSRRRWLIPAVVGGAALALGGSALAFELSGRATYADYEAEPERMELLERANRRHRVAQGLAIGSVACAAAAVVVLVLRRDGRRAGAVTVAPVIDANAAGLALSRGF